MEVTQGARPDESPFNAHAQRHRCRGWKVKRIRKIAARDHQIPLAFISREAWERKLISTPPLMHVMKYMVPSELVLVTLKYQGKKESLFRENPAPLWCIAAATCVYWLIVGAMKQMPTLEGKCFKILWHAALASGVLSALALVSIFIPYPWSLVPLMIWIPLPVVLARRPILNCSYSLVNRGVPSVINKMHAIVVWARGCNSTEQASSRV